MDETRRPTLIASVQRALHLLEIVASHPGGAPAKQLAREAGLPLATAYHLLRTLAHEGYARRLPEGSWVLGDRLGSLNGQGKAQRLLGRIRPRLSGLRDELGLATYFGVFEDGEIRIVDIADGPRAPRVDLWVGFADAAHATALGKCVLAQLDEDAREDYLARHPLVDLTPHTITERGLLVGSLTTGLSIDREEYLVGAACAAVPVTGVPGVAAALAVSGKVGRLARIEESADRMRSTAARIARSLSVDA